MESRRQNIFVMNSMNLTSLVNLNAILFSTVLDNDDTGGAANGPHLFKHLFITQVK
jgi:hypothetical protein